MTTPIKRRLYCACCGERTADPWVQFWNQDTGHGMCERCADWIVTERHSMTPLEFEKCYGKAGIHRPPAKHDQQ